MSAPRTFRSQEDLSEAISVAQDVGFKCLEEERKLLLKLSGRQRQIIRNLIAKFEDSSKYNLVYLGRGFWQLNVFTWACHERLVRTRKEKSKPHERYKIRIEVIKRRKREIVK